MPLIRQKSKIFATFSQEKAFCILHHKFCVLTVGGFFVTLKGVFITNTPFFMLSEFTGFAIGAVAVGFHLQLLALDADSSAGRHGLGDKGRCADHTALTDDRFAA